MVVLAFDVLDDRLGRNDLLGLGIEGDRGRALQRPALVEGIGYAVAECGIVLAGQSFMS